jgi:hypothetical protein
MNSQSANLVPLSTFHESAFVGDNCFCESLARRAHVIDKRGMPAPSRFRLFAATFSLLLPLSLSCALADYKSDLEAYNLARDAFEAQAQVYWASIAGKKAIRNTKRLNHEELALTDYVLTQPPIYTGPAKPIEPGAPEVAPPPPKYVPLIADFLQNAKGQFQFSPERPKSELEFKRAYAKAAHAAGLTKSQIVKIYAFEVGGNGTYDSQAGLEYPRPGARAISTALGYNQLLHTNTIELLAENGDEFVQALQSKASSAPPQRKEIFRKKIEVLQHMVEFSRSVPDDWIEHEKLANTPKGLGAHALNLDIDVGPLLQVRNLVTSVKFAQTKGYDKSLTAAELEMMNLTGDGTGLDMIVMPAAFRNSVPTANFFQRSGYEANPIAARSKVVAHLLAATDSKMNEENKLQGAKDLARVFPK